MRKQLFILTINYIKFQRNKLKVINFQWWSEELWFDKVKLKRWVLFKDILQDDKTMCHGSGVNELAN